MKNFLTQDERTELESLKWDLVNPVKSFVSEVYADTVGDAKKFYTSQARKAQQQAKRVQQRTEDQMAALARRREAQQKQRKTAVKKAVILLALLILVGVLLVSIALSARAEGTDVVRPAAAQPQAETVQAGRACEPEHTEAFRGLTEELLP